MLVVVSTERQAGGQVSRWRATWKRLRTGTGTSTRYWWWDMLMTGSARWAIGKENTDILCVTIRFTVCRNFENPKIRTSLTLTYWSRFSSRPIEDYRWESQADTGRTSSWLHRAGFDLLSHHEGTAFVPPEALFPYPEGMGLFLIMWYWHTSHNREPQIVNDFDVTM